ncbi:hypothetical protein B0T16DRAFT_81087 [Cercophora newfieldiana]|uniref:Uncharacterized protein n=1 Tax=Cercophora newfieldiana TaxID=92897 RepID=A0AA39YGK9_9PEZI|nr:hypothetical protein B0T16DRAFT_81087 [Cercophora newfieldiana]
MHWQPGRVLHLGRFLSSQLTLQSLDTLAAGGLITSNVLASAHPLSSSRWPDADRLCSTTLKSLGLCKRGVEHDGLKLSQQCGHELAQPTPSNLQVQQLLRCQPPVLSVSMHENLTPPRIWMGAASHAIRSSRFPKFQELRLSDSCTVQQSCSPQSVVWHNSCTSLAPPCAHEHGRSQTGHCPRC